MRILRLPCSGNKLHPTGRISNAVGAPCAHTPDPNLDPSGGLCDSPDIADLKRPPPLGDSIANDFERLRPLAADAIRQPVRVANYADEMAANYINLYDDEPVDDLQISDEKDVLPECDALRVYRGRINPAGVCAGGDCVPTWLPDIRPFDVAKTLRECAGRLSPVEIDTSDPDPTQMTAYRYVTEWAERRDREGDVRGDPQPKMRLTLLGTAGPGETRVITSTVQKCMGIFGARGSVMVAARAGVAASNVGCGGRTMASPFRITGDTYPDGIKGPTGKDLRREPRECRILIIEEISMSGSQQLAAVSERLRQCADAESSFGVVGLVFSGDFAQLPPIGQRPLIYNARPGKRE